jgi:uncharacterized protein YggE
MFKNKYVLFATILAVVSSIFLIIGVGAGLWWLWERNLPISVLTVQGQATKKVQYDKVTVNLTISLVGSDVNSLNSEIDSKTNKIIEYLNKQGIQNNDIQTSKTSYPEYQPIVYSMPVRDGENTTQTRVETNFTVVFNNFKQDASLPNKVIAEATKLGVNRFGSFNYDFADNKKVCADLEDEATKDAFKIANDRIKALGGGRIVKKTVNLLNNCGNNNYPYPYATMGKADASAVSASSESAPSVLGGEQELTSTVDLTVEYK